jgi:hypothetical protein
MIISPILHAKIATRHTVFPSNPMDRPFDAGSYEALYGDDTASFATPELRGLNSCNVFGMRYNRNSGSRAFIPKHSTSIAAMKRVIASI